MRNNIIIGSLFLLVVLFLITALTNPTITSRVVEEIEQPIVGVSGYYSFKPSFKVNVDYDINDYNVLKEQSESLLLCQFEQDLEGCIDKKIEEFKFIPSQLPEGHQGTAFEPSKFLWSKGSCDKGYEFIFYNFLEMFDTCKNFLDDECVCSFNLDYSEKEIKENYLEGDYRFDLISEGINLRAQLEKPVKKELIIENSSIYVLDNGEIKIRNKAKFDIGYTDKKRALSILDFEPNVEKPFKIQRQIILLKKDDKLIFVSDKGNYQECEHYKEIYRFCVSTDNKVFVNNSIINKVIKDNIRYKFALTIIDKVPPPPVENIVVVDKENAEESVVVKWDKSSATDVVHYNVYYNESNFDNASKTTLLTTVNKKTEIKKYNASVNVPEDKLYYFAVTAVDRMGNENTTVKAVVGTSIDDLAPEPITELSVFIDGNTATIKWVKPDSHKDVVYYNVYQSDKEITDAEGMTPISITIENAKCLTSCKYSINLTSGEYYFAVTGVDEVPNENKTIEKSVFVKI